VRQLSFAIPVGNSYGPRSLVVHARLDRIYARTRAPGSDAPGRVTVLDRTSGLVLALVDTGLDDYGEGALHLDAGRNRLYAVNAGDSSCSIFDAESLSPIGLLQGVDRLALDEGEGKIYVAGLAGLRVLDSASHGLLLETPMLHAQRFLALEVDPIGRRVYLALQDSEGYTLRQYDATTLDELASSSLLSRPDGLASDPNRGHVYVTLSDGERNLLWALDRDGHLVEERVLGEWTQRTQIVMDPAGDRLFLAREVHRDHGITILDLESGQELADIRLELPPNALVWDAEAARVLVSHTYDHEISLVDVEAEAVVSSFPTALDLVDLAVDPQRGNVYLTDSAGQLHILDSDSDRELDILPGKGRIAVDGPHGRLYTGGEGAKRVRVFDAEALQEIGQIDSTARPVADPYHGELYLVQQGIYLTSLDTMTVTTAIPDTLPQSPGFSPNPHAVGAVVDPGSGRVFATIFNGVPGSNGGTYLYVYEPVTYEKVLTDTERSPLYVDVDPHTGKAYVSRAHMAGRSTSLLASGREYTSRLDAVFGALKVDPALARVYLSVSGIEEGHLLVLDAGNLDVLGSVPIQGGFSLRALDPERHLLYLTTQDGQVQIWSVTGGQLTQPAGPIPARPPAVEMFRLFRGPGDTPIFTGSLYRSGDEGESWQRVDHGLPRLGVQEVVVSPGFSEDGTLFAVLMATDAGLGIWRSTDRGRAWHIASRGLSDLAVTDLATSPDFSADQTLFATTRRQGLFRSTDGGQTWHHLTDRYHTPEPYPRPPGGVWVSPTYAQDQTLFVAHYGLQRSTDGGETWARSLPEMASLAFSPGFATDRTLFGWSGEAGLLRSTDGGDSWQAASAGLALTDFGSGRVIVSPDYAASKTLYFIWSPSAPEGLPQLFRSTDSARSWEYLHGEPPQAATPLELSADGRAFLALDDSARLARWSTAELDWRSAALPPMDELEIEELVLSPEFGRNRTLFAVGAGPGILVSRDAGVTWKDTGFPLRATHAMPLKLVLGPAETAFVGSPLGLYSLGRDGVWMLVSDGLPQGAKTSSPEIGADGSLRVLVSRTDGEAGPSVFLSSDGGNTWTQPIPPLPLEVIPEDLRLSPAFATDRTAFVALGWDSPQRTIDGGDWQEIGPPGEWNMSTMHLSPVFDQDELVFVRLQDNSLWRSTDRGDHWSNVSGPWEDQAPRGVVRGTGYTLDALTFSPAFGQDAVILTLAGETLYHTTDQGTTWTGVLELGALPVQAAFTPDYGQEGEAFLVQGNALYHTADRGRSWQALPPTRWSNLDEVTLLLSPTFSQDNALLVWTRDGRVYQSRDGGRSWRDISAGLPPAFIRQVLFSPGYSVDGLIFLVPHGRGLYKRHGDGPWVTTSSVLPAPTPQPPRAPTPAPTTCTSEPARFRVVWEQSGARLGCLEQPAEPVFLAEQSFERGRMIWDSTDRQIYVLHGAGTWQAFDDTFEESVDPAYDPSLPPPPQQPQRGFGKVWREQLGGPEATIGWALEMERGVDGWRQWFDHGLLVWTDAALAGAEADGTAYLLHDDGTWQALAAPPP
jgi:photosystem II stability/assembly factor-like uncharacterized protein/DNA-binding beta-propeller fold protein YncE